jgi:hypothetical protein
MKLEVQIRVAIRDAVNRKSRKPFCWGGLKGYDQLHDIAQVLRNVPPDEPETSYLLQLAMQVERAVEKNHVLVEDLREAHTWLRRIAECLRYPPSSGSDTSEAPLTSEQVKREMECTPRSMAPSVGGLRP